MAIIFLSFRNHIFCLHPEPKPQNGFLCSLIHKISSPCSFHFPYFYPITPRKGAWIGISTPPSTLCGSSKNVPHKSKIADCHHLEKWISFYISATVWPIWIKCLQSIWTVEMFKFKEYLFCKALSAIICNCLTDCDEIWYAYVHWPSQPGQISKIWKSKMAEGHHISWCLSTVKHAWMC